MIFAVVLLATQQPPAQPAAEDDIVVLAQRLRTVRFSYDAKKGVLVSCTIRHSGGQVADALVCEAARACAVENPTLGDRHLAPCIKARVRTLVIERRPSRQLDAGRLEPK